MIKYKVIIYAILIEYLSSGLTKVWPPDRDSHGCLLDGYIDVWSADGAHSSGFAIQMESFLNNDSNLLLPAFTPELAATVGPQVVYSKNASCNSCP